MNLENGEYKPPIKSAMTDLEQMLLECDRRIDELDNRITQLSNEVGRLIDLVRLGFAKVGEML